MGQRRGMERPHLRRIACAKRDHCAVARCRRAAVEWLADPETDAIVVAGSPADKARIRARHLPDAEGCKHCIVEPCRPCNIADADSGVEGHGHGDSSRTPQMLRMLPFAEGCFKPQPFGKRRLLTS